MAACVCGFGLGSENFLFESGGEDISRGSGDICLMTMVGGDLSLVMTGDGDFCLMMTGGGDFSLTMTDEGGISLMLTEGADISLTIAGDVLRPVPD
jgi:hypothetical protein